MHRSVWYYYLAYKYFINILAYIHQEVLYNISILYTIEIIVLYFIFSSNKERYKYQQHNVNIIAIIQNISKNYSFSLQK